jgi:aspartyl-tRNA(Asn)/glutamyl-tRNA(Gln) amidotransferase subunit B
METMTEKKYESVIGLEVHVQLKTASKLFCACETDFGAAPNSHVCPVCTGQPGVLPVLNKKAVEGIVKAGLALGCSINQKSFFARKQYFYPDLPKAYQISQSDQPVCRDGQIVISSAGGPKTIRIQRIHLEEDAGKLLHAIGSTELPYSLVDLNRSSIPLIEIVSHPDLSSSDEAYEYLSKLKANVQYVGVSDCDMEKGSLRCDANVSIRLSGATTLGTRVEIKNMNSFRAVKDAIDHEIERQIELVEGGGRVVQETRLWNEAQGTTAPMRSKEEAHDYRYFPDNAAAAFHQLNLAFDFMVDGVFDRAETVHVFYFNAGTQRGRAAQTNGHVGVAAERALFHVAVGNAHVLDVGFELGQIFIRLVGTRQIRMGNDFNQRNAGAV